MNVYPTYLAFRHKLVMAKKSRNNRRKTMGKFTTNPTQYLPLCNPACPSNQRFSGDLAGDLTPQFLNKGAGKTGSLACLIIPNRSNIWESDPVVINSYIFFSSYIIRLISADKEWK